MEILNFEYPQHWHTTAPKSWKIMTESVGNIRERMEKKGNTILLNKIEVDSYNSPDGQFWDTAYYLDLLRVVEFFEESKQNKEFVELAQKGTAFRFVGDVENIVCPISQKIIKKGEEVLLFYYQEEKEFYFYSTTRLNFFEFVKRTYKEEVDFEMEESLIKNEIILNRWQKRIIDDRIDRNKELSNIKQVLKYYNELNNKTSESLI